MNTSERVFAGLITYGAIGVISVGLAAYGLLTALGLVREKALHHI